MTAQPGGTGALAVLVAAALSLWPGLPDMLAGGAGAPPGAYLKRASSAEFGIPNLPRPDAFDQLAAFIRGHMQQDCVPGVAAAVVRGRQTVFAEGFGQRDVARGLPVTPDTLFHIGSTQKSMTSMLTAMLVDRAVLHWDDPAVRIYSAFRLASGAATQQVTLRHLLSMRSGIPDGAEDDFDPATMGPADVFDVVAASRLLGPPGTVFSYSNLSYAVAGYLAVLASGGHIDSLYEDYANLLWVNVLEPLGMQTATLSYTEAQASPNHSRSYTCVGGRVRLAEPEDFDPDPLAPAGGLKAGAAEMARYVNAQLNRGLAPDGKRIVSEGSLTETWIPYLEDYAMGWEVTHHAGTRVILHAGGFDNFESLIGFMPDLEAGFVLLANAETAESMMQEAPSFLAELLSQATLEPATLTPAAATSTPTHAAATPGATGTSSAHRLLIWLPSVAD
jgi:CubicO group peptidase (beta-lactamase class C family)